VATILMAIGGYSINDYWWLFYQWLLVVVLLMSIGGYFINGYW
jgi:4-hydroxybenzoate polyprenyltransferase